MGGEKGDRAVKADLALREGRKEKRRRDREGARGARALAPEQCDAQRGSAAPARTVPAAAVAVRACCLSAGLARLHPSREG